MKNNTQIVIGRGDVGLAMINVLSKKYQVESFDIADEKNLSRKEITGEVIHICFPYSDQFVSEVKKYQEVLKPKFIIIHSTVAVGTTEKIPQAVHSPVRGVHKKIGSIPGSSIEEGLLGWKKQIGGPNKLVAETKKIFESVGIETVTYNDSKITELGKLLCNIQWALSLAFTQEMKRICDHFDLDFDVTVKEMNKMYNEGAINLEGKYKDRIRPVCFPGHIGGDCLMSNIEILKEQKPSKFFDLIKESNQEFEEQNN
jgi:UDP-N-acetyl-D-mannosaminuronate dehydrogenase